MDISNLMKESQVVYEHLGDELSKDIFCHRLLYAFTGDIHHIFKIVQCNPKAKEIIDKLNSIDISIPKYIYGAGIRGRALKKIWSYDWGGFIDRDEKLSGTNIEGIPVLSYQNIKEQEDMAVIVPNRFYADEIVKALLESGVKREYIFNISDIWNELLYKQYFDLPELIHLEDEVFIDSGSFDGFSTIRFSEWSGNDFKRVYIWEPERENMQICMEKLKETGLDKRCVFINKAAWNSIGSISFTENGVKSSIDKSGDGRVATSTIENELCDFDIPTFIKMDIEGAEKQALFGCEKLIKKYKPKLAISIYHKKEDILDLPKIILDFNSEYQFYLRHYSYAEWDTVLYAVPK